MVDLKVVSIATEDLDESVATFRKNFGFPVTRTAPSASGKTRTVCLGIGAAEIEMATPADEGSPLASFLAERGPGLHQLVLEVDDLAAAQAELAARGIEVSVKPLGREACGFSEHRADPRSADHARRTLRSFIQRPHAVRIAARDPLRSRLRRPALAYAARTDASARGSARVALPADRSGRADASAAPSGSWQSRSPRKPSSPGCLPRARWR